MPSRDDDGDNFEQAQVLITAQYDTSGLIERSSTNFEKLGKAKMTVVSARSRLAHVQSYWDQFQKRHLEIHALTTREERTTLDYFKKNEFEVTAELFEAAAAYFDEFISRVSRTVPSTAVSSDGSPLVETRAPRLKLPPIELPSFSGELRSWENFRDMFSALIDKNDTLDDVQRLHYLKRSLTGDASLVLRNTTVTSANYKTAWKLVTDRFDNKRSLINAHLKSILDLTKMRKETSLADLKLLRDQSSDIRAALTNLNRPLGEDLFIYIVTQKFDTRTLTEWEKLFGSGADMPTFDQFDEFMSTQIRILESVNNQGSPAFTHKKQSVSKPESVKTFKLHHTTVESKAVESKADKVRDSKCLRCGNNHPLFMCYMFKRDKVPARKEFAAKHKLCTICLKSGHAASVCRSERVCFKCSEKHNSLLHDSPQVIEKPVPSASNRRELSPTIASHHIGATCAGFEKSILPTAIVTIASIKNRVIKVRALIDQCVQAPCISKRAADLLGLAPRSIDASMASVTCPEGKPVNACVSFRVIPSDPQYPSFLARALVLNRVSSYKPPLPVTTLDWPHLKGLEFADPDPFSNEPFDLLLCAREYAFIILDGLRKGPYGAPVAQLTSLGWILSGADAEEPSLDSLGPVNLNHIAVSNHEHIADEPSLADILQRFWEIEEVPVASKLSDDEMKCESHFVNTHSRLPDGRYEVSLPFKGNRAPDIGETYHIAKRQFLSLERRLHQKPDLLREYKAVMSDLIESHHMEPVDSFQTDKSHVFIPHLPVIRDDKVTTKVRVVFNASCKSNNGKSLNDSLHIGAKLLNELFSLVLRWRLYKFVLVADLAKMYRQIRVALEDTKYQLILWREHPDEVLKVYRLLTVTFGTACAPFLAIRVLKQLGADVRHLFPLAAEILDEDLYVDDALLGAPTKAGLLAKREELREALKAGGFCARKWAGNHPDLLEGLPAEDHGLALPRDLTESDKLKVLGIQWSPMQDRFTFAAFAPQHSALTKRTFLSILARIYDPLGWLAPYVVVGKILIQLLWLQKLDWDDQLSPDLHSQATRFIADLDKVSQVSINRWVGVSENARSIEMHGFGDASERAYAAVVYLRVVDSSGAVTTSLLCAKTKVAPLKLQSIPRLELNAAALLCKLLLQTCAAMKLADVRTYAWSDSQNVLCWLRTPPSALKNDVANRVSFIQTSMPDAVWRHVPGHSNPADCASRGMQMDTLISHDLWWSGPSWLSLDEPSWPQTQIEDKAQSICETRAVHVTTVTSRDREFAAISRNSKITRMIRATAFVLRFIYNCRHPGRRVVDDEPTTSEILSAERALVRSVQREHYREEIIALKNKRPIPVKSSIASLTPFLDQRGLLRVLGRIENSGVSDEEKHPYIIPRGHYALVLARSTHLALKHGGIQVTLRVLRERFWIVSSRSLVRSIIHNCVICTRFKRSFGSQLMGQVPAVRLQKDSRAFQFTGVDYGGPLQARLASGRGHKSHKCYIVLFVCMTTRACHIELVEDYSSAAFLAAFDCFCNRRGLPQEMWSDNGTNFVGAARELKENYAQVMRDQSVRAHVANNRVEWRFIPPNAPHFGGIWEAGIKSVKHHLRRVLGDSTPTVSELRTLLTGIEAILNSRPLVPLTDDPGSFDACTPAHILIGGLLVIPPTPSLYNANPNYLTRWQNVRRRLEQFWRIWSTDFLNSLQQRIKWKVVRENLKVGNLVLIKDQNLPPAKWLLGRIIDLKPGRDNLVRVVTVRTATSTFTRSIAQICLLPVANAESSS